MSEWNSRDALPLDGTTIRILWSNGKQDVGRFERVSDDHPFRDWLQEHHPAILENGGEWTTLYGEGDNAEFHPIGWLPMDDETEANQ